ncbi:MAG: SEL1-like repeat protein [Proteobacteria bacterium]|nr:SEL1-like repeat protein [Pseudomonadota bacterium]
MNFFTPFVRLVAANLRAEKFTHLDVGCSGGMDPVWRLFGARFRAIGFDISIDACKDLRDQEIQPDVHYVDGAVGIPPDHPFARRIAGRTVGADRLGSRLSAHDLIARRAARLKDASLAEKLNANAWTMTALADGEQVYILDTLKKFGFDDVDFLKIDVDGPDFLILNSLEGEFARLGMLAVRLEVGMTGGTDEAEHTFHNTDRFMRQQGFDLVALDNRSYSNRTLPAKFLYPMPAQTVTGRIFQSEAFYARDPVGSPELARSLSAEKLLKLAAIYAVWNQPDSAAEILVTFRDRLASLLDIDAALDLLAADTQSGEAQPKSYKAYLDAYRSDDEFLYPRHPEAPTLMQRLRAVWVAMTDRPYIAKIEALRQDLAVDGFVGPGRTRRAAEQGDPQAQFALGVAYLHGQWLPVDKVEALKWFTLAAANAAPEAKASFTAQHDALARQLSDADRHEAANRAAAAKK